MYIKWPLSKSSTVMGCCQSSSVVINGWLFSKTPRAGALRFSCSMLGGGDAFQAGVPGPISPSQSSPFAPHPAGGWLAGKPCSPRAERCPSPACTGGALAAGRVQAGSSLSSCLLHKGTILGALCLPRQGTSSLAVQLPPPDRKETSMGMGTGTGTAPGAQQRAWEAMVFLKEGEKEWGKAVPAGGRSSALGLEEAVSTLPLW